METFANSKILQFGSFDEFIEVSDSMKFEREYSFIMSRHHRSIKRLEDSANILKIDLEIKNFPKITQKHCNLSNSSLTPKQPVITMKPPNIIEPSLQQEDEDKLEEEEEEDYVAHLRQQIEIRRSNASILQHFFRTFFFLPQRCSQLSFHYKVLSRFVLIVRGWLNWVKIRDESVRRIQRWYPIRFQIKYWKFAFQIQRSFKSFKLRCYIGKMVEKRVWREGVKKRVKKRGVLKSLNAITGSTSIESLEQQQQDSEEEEEKVEDKKKKSVRFNLSKAEMLRERLYSTPFHTLSSLFSPVPNSCIPQLHPKTQFFAEYDVNSYYTHLRILRKQGKVLDSEFKHLVQGRKEED